VKIPKKEKQENRLPGGTIAHLRDYLAPSHNRNKEKNRKRLERVEVFCSRKWIRGWYQSDLSDGARAKGNWPESHAALSAGRIKKKGYRAPVQWGAPDIKKNFITRSAVGARGGPGCAEQTNSVLNLRKLNAKSLKLQQLRETGDGLESPWGSA